MTDTGPPTMSGSRRRSWSTIPESVRARIGECAGAPVVRAVDQPGGFSEGLAARVLLDNAGTAFVKAVHAPSAPVVAEFHRAELSISAALPAAAPTPRLLGSHDDGEWVALIFTDIVGRLPAQPWRDSERERVLEALTGLAQTLTPAPQPAGTRPPRLGGWHRLAESPVALERLHEVAPGAVGDLAAHLELEAGLGEVLVGNTLVHGDLYPFNLLLTDRRVVFVDWAHAWVGPR